jgi:thiol:disulfide interchange protein DsbD
VNLSPGWHMNAHEPLEEYLIPTVLRVTGPEGFGVEKIAYPEAKLLEFAFSPDQPLAVYEERFEIGVEVRVPADAAPGSYALEGVLEWQACNDKTCWRPEKTDVRMAFTVAAPGEAVTPQNAEVFEGIDFETAEAVAPSASAGEEEKPEAAADEGAWRELAEGFEIAGRNSGYIDSDDFVEWIRAVEAGTARSELGIFEGRSMLAIVLLTVLGGLALNLTPCVLPLIPINLAIIGAGTQAGSKSRGFLLGGLYGLGIALVYGVLGLIVVLGTGTFGQLNASPWFNLAIAALFVVLGLAMFDVFFIDFSRFQGKLGMTGQRGSLLLAFGMGCVIALLAGACVAPVVIAVVLLSRDLYAQGSPVGVALPFLLGLGMALPWPFAGAGLSFLPKPGKWMEYVKYAFGVLILGFAGYYGWQGVDLLRNRYFVDREAVLASTEGFDEEGWTASLAEGLAQAKAENKPVFIDFWATWCKNCMVMNKTTFKDPAVQEVLKDYVKVKYQAERMDESPAKEVLEHFDVTAGLPAYRVLEAKGEQGRN